MREVKTFHVRRQTTDYGNPRYRYSIGRFDYSQKDLHEMKGFKFKYGVSMRPADIRAVKLAWKEKLSQGEK